MTDTPTATRSRRWLIPVIVLAVLLVAALGLLAKTYADLGTTQQTLSSTESDLDQSKQTVRTQTQRADEAEANLTTCAAAFTEQKGVTDELRDEATEGFGSISTNLGTLGATPLNSDELVAKIKATNDKEAAIDSSGCDAAS